MIASKTRAGFPKRIGPPQYEATTKEETIPTSKASSGEEKTEEEEDGAFLEYIHCHIWYVRSKTTLKTPTAMPTVPGDTNAQ